VERPNFSEDLGVISWPKVTKSEVATGNAIARWLRHAPRATRVEKLVGGPVHVRVGSGPLDDPNAAVCAVRVNGHAIAVRGASGFVRRFAQQLLGGPEELAAPRALTNAEVAMWTMLVAAAVEDLGIAGEVWPVDRSPSPSPSPIVLDLILAGTPWTIELAAPSSVGLAAPRPRIPGWADAVLLDCPIIVGRCWLARADVARLKRRSVVTLERTQTANELVVLGGRIGVEATPDPVVARACTEYVAREMGLPDEARIELTVGVGSATMSLRQVMGLAVGEVVPLGRPLAGPFEVRAAGTLIGQGELVDVDGELGVRIVSFVEEK